MLAFYFFARPIRFLFAPLLLLGLPAAQALATTSNGTWTQINGGGTSWATTGNWLSGIVGGATGSGTTDTGTATFSATNVGLETIALDQTRNLQNITFSATSASGYTINSSIFDLTSGGTIQTTASDLGVDTINSTLVLEGANGTYTFTSGSTTAADTLNFGGVIVGGAAGGTLLTLAGANTGNNTISGNIGNGLATALSLASTGNWVLSGNNTFTGNVSIQAGTLTLGSAGALSSTANSVSVFNGATLDLAGQTIGAIPSAILGAGVGGNGALINSSANPASYAGAITGNNGPATIGGNGQIILSGSVSNSIPPNVFQLTKIGNDTLILSGTTDNFNLGMVVDSGTVILAKTSSSSPVVHAIGQPGLTVNGGIAQLGGTGGDQIFDLGSVTVSSGAFDTAGQSETFDNLSLAGAGIAGNGALLNSAAGASVITPTGGTTLTANITIGVLQASGSLTLNGPIGGGFGITKVGPGTFTISGNNTFTGTTTIAGGSLIMSGGSLASSVLNQSNFIFDGGAFGGRLTNQGTATFNADFIAGNGMENDGATLVAAGVNMTLNGAGLNNTSSLSMTGGTLTLSPSGTNSNSGTLSLAAPARLNLTSAPLTNTGTLSLNGAMVSGTGGTLTNGQSGDIFGTGTVTCSFSNAGLLAVGGGAMNITPAFNNSGLIQLTALNSTLTGGAVTNTGSIRGIGSIGNAVTNNGDIEPFGGILFLGGTLSNSASGLIRVAATNQLVINSGLVTNAGIINLTGGTFDNNNHPMNNIGEISGWGTLATGGTGLDNNGSITFSGGVTTVNGPVMNEGGKTITVAQNPAVFTGLVTNNMSATFNTVNATATFAGGFVNNGNSNFVKAGGGTVEIDAAPVLNNGSTLSVTTGTMRFNVVSGTPTIGTGVTAVVSSGATLELAGTVSALANEPNRVNIINNSSTQGILVSGTNQQVGDIDGSGTTQVNAGSDLTANHIIQSALVIGGTSKNPGLATIDASDSSGNPLAIGPSILSSLASDSPLGAEVSSTVLSGDPTTNGLGSAAPALSNLAATTGMAAVPEPSTMILLAIGGLTGGLAIARRRLEYANDQS